jgi:hypothetical protein
MRKHSYEFDMNGLIDTDDEEVVASESCASTSLPSGLSLRVEDRDSERSRTVSTLSLSNGRTEEPNDLKLVEILIDKIIKRLEENSFQPKVQDALKAIQLKQKMTIFFYGEFRTNLKIHFLTMKKMKNSHPQVQQVQQVHPVGQEPRAPNLQTGLIRLPHNIFYIFSYCRRGRERCVRPFCPPSLLFMRELSSRSRLAGDFSASGGILVTRTQARL